MKFQMKISDASATAIASELDHARFRDAACREGARFREAGRLTEFARQGFIPNIKAEAILGLASLTASEVDV
jgi:hypothetical protein